MPHARESVAAGGCARRRVRAGRFRVAASAALAACLVPLADASHALAPSGPLKLAPHRAVYDMTLDRTRAGAGVAGIKGRMVFDFSGSSCDGYTLNMRLVTRVTDPSGRATVTDLRSSTWEQGAGRDFQFSSTQYLNQKLNETTRGKAARAARGEGIEIELDAPSEGRIEMAGEILFPTQHSLAILRAALKGRKVVQANVYDGSQKGRKLYATTTFIGKTKSPGSNDKLDAVENGEALDKLPSWPVAISYFDTGNPAEVTPSYELTFRLYANGVSRNLRIDYGDFSVLGSLRSLEVFKPPQCR